MKFQLFETCTAYLVQIVIPNSIKMLLFETKFTGIHFFHNCTTYLVQNGIANSMKIPFLELKITEVHFFETCTTYLVQNDIQKSTKGNLDPHFWSGAVQDEPGRPAGPARPPGPAWPPGGLLCGRGRREERRGGAAQRRGWSPPTPITAGGLFGRRT